MIKKFFNLFTVTVLLTVFVTCIFFQSFAVSNESPESESISYYYRQNNKISMGWQFTDDSLFHFDSSGATQTGWIFTDNEWFYLITGGQMHTGWLFDNGSWYYLNSNGAMVRGWLFADNSWFYFNSSGAMQTGWIFTDNEWFYLTTGGQMHTGWLFDNGVWYYLNPNGSMARGWLFTDNSWFYFNGSGAMQTGWVNDGSHDYFLGTDGAMLKDTYTPDGYYVDSEGRKSQTVPNQQTLNRNKILIGSTLYYDNSGIIDDQHFKEIEENGIDFLITETKNDQSALLNYSEKYNIGVIGAHYNFGCWGGQSNGELQNLNEQIKTGQYSFNNYKAHKARVGDHIFDEPISSEFSSIAQFYELYKNNTHNKFLFVNLLPAMASSDMLGEATYREYITKFADTVKTDYICFDSYPFLENGVLEATYLKSLNTVADVCRKNNRDMWNYIQSQGNWGAYVLPTYQQVLWQTYSSLAFGSKAILHVSYNPIWDDNAVAMLDEDGNKTELWYDVKRVNDNIKAISDNYMQYHYFGTYAFGDFCNSALKNQLEELNHENSDYMAEQNYFNDIIACVSSDQSVVIGFFRNPENNKRAFVIVNMQNPTDVNSVADIEVRIPDSNEISYVKDAQSENMRSDDGVFCLSLEYGEGLFVEVNDIN